MLALATVLLALTFHGDDFCRRVPLRAWTVTIDRAVDVARNYYSISEPDIERLRECLRRPPPK